MMTVTTVKRKRASKVRIRRTHGLPASLDSAAGLLRHKAGAVRAELKKIHNEWDRRRKRSLPTSLYRAAGLFRHQPKAFTVYGRKVRKEWKEERSKHTQPAP